MDAYLETVKRSIRVVDLDISNSALDITHISFHLIKKYGTSRYEQQSFLTIESTLNTNTIIDMNKTHLGVTFKSSMFHLTNEYVANRIRTESLILEKLGQTIEKKK